MLDEALGVEVGAAEAEGAGDAAAAGAADVLGAISTVLGIVAVPSLDFEPLPSPRKSVTYQPEPFSAKPAAVTCLTKDSFPQAVQCVSGGSLILRSTS